MGLVTNLQKAHSTHFISILITPRPFAYLDRSEIRDLNNPSYRCPLELTNRGRPNKPPPGTPAEYLVRAALQGPGEICVIQAAVSLRPYRNLATDLARPRRAESPRSSFVFPALYPSTDPEDLSMAGLSHPCQRLGLSATGSPLRPLVSHLSANYPT